MKKLFVIAIIGLMVGIVIGGIGQDYFFGSSQKDLEVPFQTEVDFIYPIKPGETFSSTLQDLDFSAKEIDSLARVINPHVNLARLAPGAKFFIKFPISGSTKLSSLKLHISKQLEIVVTPSGSAERPWLVEKVEREVKTKVVSFQGVVEDSLWDSAEKVNMPAAIISDLAEIFAWQVDFAREVRQGDKWRLSVEQELIDNETVGWGRVLSAEYINQGESFTAILFQKANGEEDYFSMDGGSLKRTFLKSPIQFGRISSRYQNKRLHPVLGVYKAHRGVDYAAPVGTPIRAVGDGVIQQMGYMGGGGNVIKLRHNSVYTTAYKHLSRFARGMRSGVTIKQGQIIGYVGATGLASGPHLHFEFYVNGTYVDPLKQKFPNAESVSPQALSEFSVRRKAYMAYLPGWM